MPFAFKTAFLSELQISSFEYGQDFRIKKKKKVIVTAPKLGWIM